MRYIFDKVAICAVAPNELIALRVIRNQVNAINVEHPKDRNKARLFGCWQLVGCFNPFHVAQG